MSERFGQDLLLLERLAAGGMAEVYRAKQIGYGGFEKTVAVKRILPNFASDEEFKGMFRQEANLSGCLQHQNIVQVFGNGEHDGYLYLVMEFVDGKNVRQILSRCERKKKRIPIELSLFIVAETAKGLQYAHSYLDEKSGEPLSIVHRDMSPQNIMVGYDASVKIVDFGIAKAASWADNTRAGVLKGKFGYMSPEQARGEKLDNRTDIFALGIILFETLTQRRLFTSDDDLRTIKMVKECNIPRPSKYNPAITSQLDRIVLKALEKNKADRYQNAQELYEDLIVYLNQKFPKFVPTELSRFQKDIFKEDIEEFKKKREKQAAEAPAVAGNPNPPNRNKNAAAIFNDKDKTDTGGDQEEKTQLSQSNSQVKEMEAPVPEGLEIPTVAEKEARPPLPSKETRVEPKLTMSPEPFPDFSAPPESELSFTSSGLLREPEPRVDGSPKNGKTKPSPFATVKTNTDLRPEPELKLMDDFRTVPAPQAPPPVKSGNRMRLYLVAAVILVAFGVVATQGDSEVSPITQENRATETSPELKTEKDPAPPVVAGESETPNEAVVASPSTPEVPVDQPPSEPADGVAIVPKTDELPVAVAPKSAEPRAVEAPVNRPPASLPSRVTLRELQGPSGPYGRIRINTIPRSDEFYINGKLVVDEQGQPFKVEGQDFLLPPGEFQVELRNVPFEKTWSGNIQIRPDIRQEKDIVFK